MKTSDLSDAELDAIFAKIDRDGNKTLDKAELGLALSQTGKLKSEVDKFLRQLGDDFKPLTSAEFKDVIRGKGELGKKFSGQLSTTLADLSTETGLRKLFDEIDRDKGARRVVLRPYSRARGGGGPGDRWVSGQGRGVRGMTGCVRGVQAARSTSSSCSTRWTGSARRRKRCAPHSGVFHAAKVQRLGFVRFRIGFRPARATLQCSRTVDAIGCMSMVVVHDTL
jgi:hypothetical protein